MATAKKVTATKKTAVKASPAKKVSKPEAAPVAAPVAKKAPAAKKVAAPATAAKTAAKTAQKAVPAKKRTPSASFMKAMTPSAALAAVIGDKPLPRTEVTKKIWEYIKAHGLQDQAKKTMINADAKLKKIFEKAQVSMFEMTKLISSHLK